VADGESALDVAWQLSFVDERHGEVLGGHVADRAVRGHEQLSSFSFVSSSRGTASHSSRDAILGSSTVTPS
jgi:hypothetical protein